MTEVLPTFEKLRSYDTPELLFSMIWDNEITKTGAVKALFSPEGLTPAEREGIESRIKQAGGGNRIINTLAGIATNPYVWLMFVTSPAAFRGLSEAGKGVFNLATRYASDVRQNAPVLQGWHMLTPLQMFRDTPTESALMQLADRLPQLTSEATIALDAPVSRIIRYWKAQGVDLSKHGLNPQRYIRGSRERDIAQRINDAIVADLHRLDVDHTEYTPVFTKKDGKPTVAAAATHRKALIQTNMEEELERLGATGLRDAIQRQLMVRAFKLYGKELDPAVLSEAPLETLRSLFEVDVEKTRRLYEGLRLMRKDQPLSQLNDAQGREALAKVMGADLEHLLEEGIEGLTQADLDDLVRKTVEIPIRQNGKYLPRNVRGTVGVQLTGADLAAFDTAHRFTSARVVIPRLRGRPYEWHPDDLQRLSDQFGGTEAMLSDEVVDGEIVGALTRMKAKDADALAKGEAFPVFRMDLTRSFDRYNKDTAETIAFFIDDVNPITRIKLSSQFDPTRVAEADAIANKALKDGQRMATYTQRIQRGEGMMGERFRNPRNIGEVIARTAMLTEDQHARTSLVNLIVPRITGHLPRETGLLAGMMLQAKQGVHYLMNSQLGKSLRKGTEDLPFGKRFWGQMEYFSDPTITNTGRTFDGWLARYLYSTHLGINLGSVMLNIMQPMVHAATWAGVGNVLKGYTAAFREMFSYMGERMSKYGVRALTREEQTGLIRKHFKFAKDEDLLGIERSLPQALDALTFHPGGSFETAGRRQGMLDLLMKPFEKAEWINRSIAAHAMENLYRQTGRWTDDVASPAYAQMKFDIQRIVQETQFGGSPLNQPLMFMEGFLANGLLRQFLQFPTRAFTATFHTGPMLAGQDFWPGFASTFFRGMGVSALTYETFKGLIGADLSRGLFAAASTDLFGGDRFLEDGNEWIPVPPVADIPLDFIKAILSDDYQLMQQTIPRMIPGGVAASRALNATLQLPRTPLMGLPGSLQRTYVEWFRRDENGNLILNTSPDMKYPLMRSDGTLLGYEDPVLLLAKQFGIDLGTFKDEAELTHFLIQNRDEIVRARHEYLRLLFANNISGANRVKWEFERRFKIPLTVTKDQVAAMEQQRTVSRGERLLDRFPAELRDQFAPFVGEVGRSGVIPEAFRQPMTVKERTEAYGRPIRPAPTPEAVEEMRKAVAAGERAKALREGRGASAPTDRSFAGFEAFR